MESLKKIKKIIFEFIILLSLNSCRHTYSVAYSVKSVFESDSITLLFEDYTFENNTYKANFSFIIKEG